MWLLDAMRRVGAILKITRKGSREEFTLYLKLVILGIAVVGTIGFIIKLITTVLIP